MLSVKIGIKPVLWICIAVILLTASRIYLQKSSQVIVGIVNTAVDLDLIVKSFTTSLQSEMGHKNIKIISFNAGHDQGSLDDFLEYLFNEKPDVLVTLTSSVTAKVQKRFAGTQTPIIFALVVDPVGSGFVESIKRPGENLTGVRADSYELKRLEWAMKLFPGLKTIHVNFNPDDMAMVKTLALLKAAAHSRHVNLRVVEYNSVESLMNSLSRMPEHHRLIWQLPSPAYSSRYEDFIQSAGNKNKIVLSHLPYWVKRGGLMTFGIQEESVAEQLMSYTRKIIDGISPAVLRVEHCEAQLLINISTARDLGIHIPESLASQAIIIQ